MSSEELKKFISFLVADKHVQDPDVLLFKGVLENDRQIVTKAVKNGANVNVTDTEIVNRYSHFHKEYSEKQTRMSNVKDKIFQKFIYYLVDVKHVPDPDVHLFKAVFDNDSQTKEKLDKAIKEGANVNVTDTQIIRRYSHFYKEFLEVIAKLMS